jgi:hypothetical protein
MWYNVTIDQPATPAPASFHSMTTEKMNTTNITLDSEQIGIILQWAYQAAQSQKQPEQETALRRHLFIAQAQTIINPQGDNHE